MTAIAKSSFPRPFSTAFSDEAASCAAKLILETRWTIRKDRTPSLWNQHALREKPEGKELFSRETVQMVL